MTYDLIVHTAYWTESDIEHGANDSELTRTESLEFDTLGEVARFLVDQGITNPSNDPWLPNVNNTWLCDESYDNPATEYIEQKAAHFDGDFTTDQKTAVLTYVIDEWDRSYGDNDSAGRAIQYMLNQHDVTMSESEFTDHYQGEYDSFAEYIRQSILETTEDTDMPDWVQKYIDWEHLAADSESDYHLIEAPYGGVWVFRA